MGSSQLEGFVLALLRLRELLLAQALDRAASAGFASPGLRFRSRTSAQRWSARPRLAACAVRWSPSDDFCRLEACVALRLLAEALPGRHGVSHCVSGHRFLILLLLVVWANAPHAALLASRFGSEIEVLAAAALPVR